MFDKIKCEVKVARCMISLKLYHMFKNGLPCNANLSLPDPFPSQIGND